MEKPSIHAEICQQLNDIYTKKNHDYGDSFAQIRARRSDAILIRLFDKYLRLETLMDGVEALVPESIDDTLKDMANYCIMELIERRRK